ncbi:MAG: hypothetical protein ACRC5C_05660, partial [Bacilli bacterium]
MREQEPRARVIDWKVMLFEQLKTVNYADMTNVWHELALRLQQFLRFETIALLHVHRDARDLELLGVSSTIVFHEEKRLAIGQMLLYEQPDHLIEENYAIYENYALTGSKEWVIFDRLHRNLLFLSVDGKRTHTDLSEHDWAVTRETLFYMHNVI